LNGDVVLNIVIGIAIVFAVAVFTGIGVLVWIDVIADVRDLKEHRRKNR
jgi:hypothetical protein